MTATTSEPPVRLALHSGQAQVYQSPARFRVLVAGRRWGKTHKARTGIVARALKMGAGRYWYIAPTLKSAKDIFWEDLKAAIDPSWLAGKPNESELFVRLRGGQEIRLHGAEDPDSLRGRALRYVVLDEYADMKPQTWTEAIRPALADWKAPALFIGTPKSFNHFYDLFQRGQSPDPKWANWAAWQFRSIDNPTLDPAEIEEARQTTDPRTFRQEWEASFEAISGRAYYAFSRQLDVRPVQLTSGLPVAVSFDFNINPATATIGQSAGGETRFWREVWVSHAGGEATRAAAVAVKQKLREANWTGQIRVYGDPSGKSAKTTGPSDHAILRELFPGATWCIPHAAPHVRDRVAAVNARCETMDGKRHLVVDPTCVHLIADLEQVIFKDNGDLDKTTNAMLTHISDAGGYWVHQEWPVQKPRVSTGAVWMEHLL